MKKSLLEKLKAYSLTAGAVAAGTAGQSQVLYTDVDPDTLTSGINNSYDLDLNNDNVVDFTFNIIQSTNSGSFTWTSGFFNYSAVNTGIMLDPVSGNEVLGNWAQALSSGMVIQNQQYGWNGYSYNRLVNQSMYQSSYSYQTYYGSYFNGSWSGTWTGGNFNNAVDKYVGLRIDLNGNTHYGWARLDVLSPTQFVIKDYAIELTPNKFIMTGDTGLAQNASPAQLVTAVDVGDDGNGNDINVTFDAGANEITVGLYRIIMVKETAASAFDLSAAQAAGSGEYFPIVPDGSPSYSQTLYAGMKDSDGDVITTGVPYVAFIHSVHNINGSMNDNLSAPSDTVVLEHLSSDLGAVQGINLSDVDNFSNGLDLEANFNALADESNLDEYRVFIVKSANASTFGLPFAQSNSNYLAVNPTGQNISTVMLSTSTDVDGDLITTGVPYRAFVMSVALSGDDALSAASNEVTLDENIGVEDVAAEALRMAYVSEGVQISAKSGEPIERYEVYSADGKLVASGAERNQTLLLSNSQFSAGIYIARIQTSAGIATLKMVLQ